MYLLDGVVTLPTVSFSDTFVQQYGVKTLCSITYAWYLYSQDFCS